MFNLRFKNSPSFFARNLKKCNTKLRFLNTKSASQKVTPLTTKLIFDSEEIKAYNSVFPKILDVIKKQSKDLPEVTQRNEMILKRLLPHNMLIEGLKVQALYKVMEPPEKQTLEKQLLSRILGWSYDLIVSSLQVNDDIIEGADIRWDYTCLYKQEDVKFLAVNDAVLLEKLSYMILKEFCSKYPWYTSSIELLHTSIVKVTLGQTMEEMFKVHKKFELCTFETHNNLTQYISTYPGVLVPIMFATYCSGDYDNELPKKAKDLLFELGIFKQIQDDMVDRDEDITLGALKWLLVQALAVASPGQKKLIHKHYGNSDPQSILVIQNLYDELDINGLYEKRRNKSFDYVCQKTKDANIRESHKQLFYKLIEILYEKKL